MELHFLYINVNLKIMLQTLKQLSFSTPNAPFKLTGAYRQSHVLLKLLYSSCIQSKAAKYCAAL